MTAEADPELLATGIGSAGSTPRTFVRPPKASSDPRQRPARATTDRRWTGRRPTIRIRRFGNGLARIRHSLRPWRRVRQESSLWSADELTSAASAAGLPSSLRRLALRVEPNRSFDRDPVTALAQVETRPV